jgi:hypothetical protein
MRSVVNNAAFALIVGILTPAIAQQGQSVITLERDRCFGPCPAYLLRIDSSGAVSFKQGPPSNRYEEKTSSITTAQFQDLVAGFTAIHFFELSEDYQPIASDGQKTDIAFTLAGTGKKITHFENGPPALRELERTIERSTNIHRWLHGDARRFTLQSPIAGHQMGGGEDLKNEQFVGEDVYARIKPGMNLLMQAAGQGNAAEVRRRLQQGEDVNADDETGWTALMVASVTVQPQTVSVLLDAGARVDQRDRHGDTALIGAAAIRFGNLRRAAEVVGILLAHGASLEATNDLGESALMWAARAGNPESINVLLKAGANPARLDQSDHDALFYLKSARDGLTFDPALVERYNQAESILERR